MVVSKVIVWSRDPFGSRWEDFSLARKLVQGCGYQRVVGYVLSHLLCRTKKRFKLRNPNRVKGFVFRGGGVGHWPVTSNDAVVVESDFFHSEFYLAGFDLYASFVKCDYQCLVDLEEFFQGVVSAPAAMSSAYMAIRWQNSFGMCLSIALWNAVCWIWLAGLHPMVSDSMRRRPREFEMLASFWILHPKV